MQTNKPTESLAGKYLTFLTENEIYGVGILMVREIVQTPDITTLPCMPPYVKGVINLRGKVIGLVDLRHRLDKPPAPEDMDTCTIILSLGNRDVGLIVDDVRDVVEFAEAELESPDSLPSSEQEGVILGLAKRGDTVTILLDVKRLLENVNTHHVAEAALA